MKSIALKTVEVVIDGTPKKLSYQAQLIEIMRTPTGDKGADIEEIRRSIKVLDALEKTGDTLQLEDADFEFMANKIKYARWPVIDRYVLQFIEDVTG
jgi:hypothetical protein